MSGVYFTGSSILLTFNEFSAGFFRNEYLKSTKNCTIRAFLELKWLHDNA